MGHKIEKSKFSDPLIFDSIDLKNKTARIIGNEGADNVTVLLTLSGITFIEITGADNITITTVFPFYIKGTNQFAGVHSRYMNLMFEPLPSQFHGTCKIWE